MALTRKKAIFGLSKTVGALTGEMRVNNKIEIN
jgi:hypothetical protein